jgi:hypothetical protein
VAKHTRRQVISSGVILAALAPFRSLTGRAYGASEREPLDAHRVGLSAARVMNTAETIYRKQTGRFATLEELNDPAFRDTYGRVYPSDLVRTVQFGATDIVPGFRAVLELSNDCTAYKALIVERLVTNGQSFAYSTDESGVISVGTVSVASGGLQLRTFVGEPTSKSQTKHAKITLSSIGMSVASFFLPTLEARDACGDCGQCFTGSASDCGTTCGELCCNLGFQTCPWCCMKFASCGCPS